MSFMKTKTLIPLLAIYLALAIKCVAVISLNNDVEREAIEKAKAFTSVVQILLPLKHFHEAEREFAGHPELHELVQRDFLQIASGVLIGSHSVITSAIFCTGSPFADFKPEDLVIVAKDANEKSVVYGVKKGNPHPLWEDTEAESRDIDVSNLGILELDEEIDTERFSIAALTREDVLSESGYTINFVGIGHGLWGKHGDSFLHFPDGNRRYYESIGALKAFPSCVYPATREASCDDQDQRKAMLRSSSLSEVSALRMGGYSGDLDLGSPIFAFNAESGRFELLGLLDGDYGWFDHNDDFHLQGNEYTLIPNHIKWILETRNKIENPYCE